MTALETIKARRSIREFDDTPIEKGTIQSLLEAAIHAPSAKNCQPWRFTVVQGASKDRMLTVVRQGIANREAEEQDIGTIRWTIKCIEQAPVTVFIHNPEGIHPWKARKEHESWWDLATVQSVGAAIENMLLAATELGLGSLWIADIWEAYPELNAWMDTDNQLVAAVSLGYSKGTPPAPSRRPLEDVVEWMS